MAAIGEYIFSVSAVSLLCGIVCGILKDCSAIKPVKLICSLILLLTVLRPVTKWNHLTDFRFSIPDFPVGESIVSQGAKAYQDAASEIIKQSTQAYIVDKAASLGLEITAEVILSGDYPPVPEGVILSGAVSPYLKLRLEELIQEELNIAKENQVWTG